ncbi:MAG: EamA family transporter [Nocardioides sp.]|nr:EamA family transporter [Nocardioides sp.]
MATLTHDEVRREAQPAVAYGLVLAVVSAVSFSLSGALASGLFATGWSTGGVLVVRIGVGALALTPLALRTLRGRWHLVRRGWRLVLTYAAVAMLLTQGAYFAAIQRMDVGPALLTEYLAPIAVVLWMWLRHGERPGRLTVVGAATAVIGIVLVLDLLGGVDVDPLGLAWAIAAMVGCAAYFVINAQTADAMPPLALAWLGLVAATAILAVAMLVGVVPFHAGTAPATYGSHQVPWWLPAATIGVLTCGVAYAAGIVAGRRLGSRLSAFLGLLEVVSGAVLAWILVGQSLGAVQLLGGVVVLAGILTVQRGEQATRR